MLSLHIYFLISCHKGRSTAKLLYQHTEHIPEQPDDVEMKIVLKNTAVKNANIHAATGGYMRPLWNLDFFSHR